VSTAGDGGGRGGGAPAGAVDPVRPAGGWRVAAAAAAAAAPAVRRVAPVEDTSAPADESDVTDEADEAVVHPWPAPPTRPTEADVSKASERRGGGRPMAAEGPPMPTHRLSRWWVVLSILDGAHMLLLASLLLGAIVADQAPAVSLAASIPDACLPILLSEPHWPMGWPAAAASTGVLVALVVGKVRSHQAGRVTLLPPPVVVLVAIIVWGLLGVGVMHGVVEKRSVLAQYCEQFLPAEAFFAPV